MRKGLLLLAVCVVAMRLHAQDAAEQYRYTFALQPMQWFNWAWRVDFEMRLGDGPGWLQFGPALYSYAETDMDNPKYYYDGKTYRYNGWYYGGIREPSSRIKGGGLDVNYKRFINPSRSRYLAAGLSYTQFNIKYWGRGWVDYIEDGLLYHAYVQDYYTQNINRLGVNVCFGYQIPTRKAFLFDMFWGLAYRHSFSDKNKPAFNESMFSYGYTGVVLMTGVRIGFMLR